MFFDKKEPELIDINLEEYIDKIDIAALYYRFFNEEDKKLTTFLTPDFIKNSHVKLEDGKIKLDFKLSIAETIAPKNQDDLCNCLSEKIYQKLCVVDFTMKDELGCYKSYSVVSKINCSVITITEDGYVRIILYFDDYKVYTPMIDANMAELNIGLIYVRRW